MEYIVSILTLILGIGYSITSLVLLKKYKQNINSYFSNTKKINLNWLKFNAHGILTLWLIVFYRIDCYTLAFISLFVISIGYFGIKQVGVFNDNFVFETKSLEMFDR